MTATQLTGRMQWHHRAQAKFADAELWFWFVNFRLSYDPAEVLPALDRVAQASGFSSFASYELLGPYDIMLRVYVPAEPGVDFGDRRDALRKAMKAEPELESLEDMVVFHVKEIVRHWCWAKNDDIGEIWVPKSEVLAAARPPAEIARVNEVGAALERAMRNGDASDVVCDEETIALLARYTGDRLITFSNRTRGIKLVILVTGSATTPERFAQAKRALRTILDQPDIPISERSLYAADEQESRMFLLMCRVDFEDFHKVRATLLQSVRETLAFVDAKTMTLVAVSDDFHCFRDALPELIRPPAPTTDASALLTGSEGQYLEVKGSVFARVDPWLKQGKELEEHDGYALKGPLKAVAGFLNSGGGTVVVGALETDRYVGGAGTLDARISQYPAIGPYFCIGLVDPTFSDRGWEPYARRIGELVQSTIDPSPGILVRLRHEQVEGRDVCVMEVDDPGEDGDEYYLEIAANASVYYGRIDNKTVPMRGSAIQRHRKQVQVRRVGRRR